VFLSFHPSLPEDSKEGKLLKVIFAQKGEPLRGGHHCCQRYARHKLKTCIHFIGATKRSRYREKHARVMASQQAIQAGNHPPDQVFVWICCYHAPVFKKAKIKVFFINPPKKILFFWTFFVGIYCAIWYWVINE
jgi:hypothetical protein